MMIRTAPASGLVINYMCTRPEHLEVYRQQITIFLLTSQCTGFGSTQHLGGKFMFH